MKDSIPPPLWVTIETTATNGGTFQTGPNLACHATLLVGLCWGGIAAQVELVLRRLGQICAADEWDITARRRERSQTPNRHSPYYTSVGQDDIALIQRGLDTIEKEHWEACWESGVYLANYIIISEWPKVQRLASELLANKTLFGREAYVVLQAHEEGNEKLMNMLDAYRAGRKEAAPPEGWNARGHWYETFDAWIEGNTGENIADSDENEPLPREPTGC